RSTLRYDSWTGIVRLNYLEWHVFALELKEICLCLWELFLHVRKITSWGYKSILTGNVLDDLNPGPPCLHHDPALLERKRSGCRCSRSQSSWRTSVVCIVNRPPVTSPSM